MFLGASACFGLLRRTKRTGFSSGKNTGLANRHDEHFEGPFMPATLSELSSLTTWPELRITPWGILLANSSAHHFGLLRPVQRCDDFDVRDFGEARASKDIGEDYRWA
jgi:hypothetical protein